MSQLPFISHSFKSKIHLMLVTIINKIADDILVSGNDVSRHDFNEKLDCSDKFEIVSHTTASFSNFGLKISQSGDFSTFLSCETP